MDEKLSQLVEVIYATAASPENWQVTLQRVAEHFSGVGGLIIFQKPDGNIGTICTKSLESAQADYEAEEWWRQDIRFTRSEQLGYMVARDAISDRHIATEHEIENLPYYTDFLGRHGLKWFGGVSISPDPKVAVALSILRSDHQGSFSEEDLGLLTLVGRHVENALRLGLRLIDSNVAQSSLAEALGRLGIGAVILNEKGRIVFQNPKMQSLVGGNLQILEDRLTSPISSIRHKIAAAIDAVGLRSDEWGDAAVKPTLIPIEDDAATLALYVLPAVPGEFGQASATLSEATTIVLVVRVALDDELDPSLLRDLFGFTLGEARLAALVGAGLSPLQASEKLGIAEATARTVLRRVFDKAKVSRQSELAALLSRIAFR